MFTIVNDLIVGISTQVEVVAPTFSELAKQINVEDNSQCNTDLKYAVLPKSFTQISGALKFVTIQQNFEIKLTKQYSSSQLDDSNKRTVTIELFDLTYDIYKKIIETKAGLPAVVINILDLSVSDPIYLESDHTSLVTSNFSIVYRVQI